MAVGSHGYFRGTVADGTAGTAYEDFNPTWSEIEDPDAVYSINGTNVRVAETGRYFVRYNVRIRQNTSNDRLTVGVRLRINTTIYEGSETEVYNRNTNNAESSNSWAGIISLTADDDLDLQYKRGADVTTHTSVPVIQCEIQVVRLNDSADTAHARYSDGAATTTHAGTTYISVAWNTIEEETDTAVIQRNGSGPGINLKGASGDRFLVCFNMNFNTSGRSQRTCRMTLGGTPLTGTSSSLYTRNANNPRGSINVVTLVEKTSASDEELLVQARTGATGEAQDGSLVRTINESGLWIMKLTDGTESCRFHDATGAQNLTTASNTELNIFNTSDWTDSASFIRVDAATVSVEKTDVYLFGANVKNVSDTISNTRFMAECFWEVDNVRQNQGTNCLFGRNNSNFASSFNTVGIFDLTANEELDLESDIVGDSGSNDATIANEVGGWAINIGTIAAILVNQTFNVRHDIIAFVNQTFNVRHDINPTTVVGRTWTIRHDIIAFVNQTFNVRHDIKIIVNQTFNVRHDVLILAGRTWNIRHDIIQFINQTWNVRHDIAQTTWKLEGITRDQAGAALGNCRVVLFKRDNVAEGSRIYTIQAHTNSNGSGNYSFTALTDGDSLYMVYAFDDQAEDVRGVTDDFLTPVVE